MAKARRPSKSQAQRDERFEEFLQQQFKQLRAELDKFEPSRRGVDGKLVQLPQAKANGTTFWQKVDSWRYGIAASVLLAVAIPTVVQMNREQQNAVVQATMPTAETAAENKADAAAGKVARQTDENERDEIEESAKPALRKKSSPPKLAARKPMPAKEIPNYREEKDSTDRMAKRALPADLMASAEAETAPAAKGGTMASEGVSAPAEERPQAMPSAPAARGAMADDAEEMKSAKVASRSAPIPDAQFRLRQERIAEEEKAEMEKLWKEFERDPKAFQRDQKRSARLRTLLARHDTKSRARRLKTDLAH